MSKELCRWCTYYRPDKRYRGVIGLCNKHNKATDVKQTCGYFANGEQKTFQTDCPWK